MGARPEPGTNARPGPPCRTRPSLGERRVPLVGDGLGDLVEVGTRRIEADVRGAHGHALHLDTGSLPQPSLHRAHTVLAGHALDGEMKVGHFLSVKDNCEYFVPGTEVPGPADWFQE